MPHLSCLFPDFTSIPHHRRDRYRRGAQAAMRQALQEYRRMKSPFELVGDRVGAVAAASIAAASVHLNPRNGPAGCGLWRLCRRLGCDGDVFPLLRSAGISGSEALRCGPQSSRRYSQTVPRQPFSTSRSVLRRVRPECEVHPPLLCSACARCSATKTRNLPREGPSLHDETRIHHSLNPRGLSQTQPIFLT